MILDCMLGTLAKRLRMLGIDTLYFKKIDDTSLLKLSIQTGRRIVTSDRELSRRGRKQGVILLKEKNLEKQLEEFRKTTPEIFKNQKPFSRCLVCNRLLEKIHDRKEIKTKVPAYVYKTQEHFAACPTCNKIYWRGTHHKNMKDKLS